MSSDFGGSAMSQDGGNVVELSDDELLELELQYLEDNYNPCLNCATCGGNEPNNCGDNHCGQAFPGRN